MQKIIENIKKYISRNKRISIATAVLVVLVCILQILRKSAYMREYVFSRNISRWLLFALSRFSNLFPFSLSEFLIYISVGLGVCLVVKIVLFCKQRKFSKAVGVLHAVLLVLLCINLLFLSLFTMSYERDSAIPYLNLPEVELNAQTVASGTIYFAQATKALEGEILLDSENNVICPYSFSELSSLILEEYSKFDEDFFSPFETKPKRLALGFVNSYAGFTGYYSPFFAESNINTYQPTVSTAVTIAHELAHSKGVMRENEANFFAYYVLVKSEDAYLQYCGNLISAQILLAESYDPQNTEDYFSLAENFSQKMWDVIQFKYDYWQRYDTIFDDIGDFFNNLYLTSSGVTSGTKSYGETADILVRLAMEMASEG